MKRDKEKELDNLFREGLENPPRTANFREDDWDAMEAMLDKDKKRGILYFLPIISGIAATLLLALGWFLMTHRNEPVIVKSNPVKPPAYNTPGKVKTLDTVTERQAIAHNSIKTIDTVTEKVASEGVSKNGKNNGSYTSHTTKHNLALTHTAVSRYAGTYTKNGGKHNNKVDAPTRTAGDVQLIENTLLAGNGEVIAANIAPINLSALSYDNAIVSQLSNNAKPEIASVPVKSKLVKQSYAKRPQLAVSVLASPDINGVSSFSNSMVGTNVGLLFSVGLTKKLTISTGALYSKKPYLTSFADYHSNSGYRFKNDPTSVTADCRVLDIPLNIDYQVYRQGRNAFSLGTGISSYIMLRENYHYNYESGVTGGPSDYDIANKNQHILGVLNLQATYQRQINSKFSLGLQPYMKVPLTNIGYGQVKLQSAGLAVGVTWNIGSLSKP
jgi:hypothetical protein